MYRPSDEDVKHMVAALLEGGNPEAGFGLAGLRHFCKSAARLIQSMRPDLRFDAPPNGDREEVELPYKRGGLDGY